MSELTPEQLHQINTLIAKQIDDLKAQIQEDLADSIVNK